MRYPQLTLLLFLISFGLQGQNSSDLSLENSHIFYLETLSDSKNQNFQKILSEYDVFIQGHPNNIIAKIERCKFIGNAFYDEYEEYNLKIEETETCISDLAEAYPHHPEVLIYRVENVYGGERLQLLETCVSRIEETNVIWTANQKSKVYEYLGDYYNYEDEVKALGFYLKARKINSTIDLSKEIATIQVSLGNYDEAKETLLPNILKDTAAWKLNEKAELLVKIGETDQALNLIKLVQEKDSSLVNNGRMADIMIQKDRLDEARFFLAKDTAIKWNRIGALQSLYEFEVKYSVPEKALDIYRQQQEEEDTHDFFAIQRLGLFFKDPALPWNGNDLLRLLFLGGALLVLAILPYLWILPIYNSDRVIKWKFEPKLDFNWTLKHFWIISFVYLAALFLISLVFYYDDWASVFSTTHLTATVEEYNPKYLANSIILFSSLLALGTLVTINKNNLSHIFASQVSVWTTVRWILLFIVVNAVIINTLRRFVDFDQLHITDFMMNAQPEIIGVLKTYGFWVAFLIVVLVGPLYEEIMFRGIVLGATEKHLGFNTANIFQAILFATIHFNWQLFLFYLVFGLITGLVTRKSKGLLNGYLLHVANNFLVLVALSLQTNVM